VSNLPALWYCSVCGRLVKRIEEYERTGDFDRIDYELEACAKHREEAVIRLRSELNKYKRVQ
jgi:hypothetical protein